MNSNLSARHHIPCVTYVAVLYVTEYFTLYHEHGDAGEFLYKHILNVNTFYHRRAL